MFGKKEQKQPKQEYQIKPAPPLPTNLPRANLTTYPQQWEYKWMLLTIAQVTDPSNILALMGTEGWELVAVYPNQVPIAGPARELFFKRPKLPEEQSSADTQK
jgi:hypothetical protein